MAQALAKEELKLLYDVLEDAIARNPTARFSPTIRDHPLHRLRHKVFHLYYGREYCLYGEECTCPEVLAFVEGSAHTSSLHLADPPIP